MALELSIDSLKSMKVADFIKAFKNKAIWKKAKHVIVFVDYKLDGKKITVAVPYKKESEMKSEMKRIKKEKVHVLKKVGAGYINFDIDPTEGMLANVKLSMGALKAELLQAKGAKLFDKIQATLKVLIADNADMESVADEEEEEEDLEEEADINDDIAEENAEQSEEEKKAEAKLVIQELARIQLDLKGEWGKFKTLVSDKSGALALIPAYGNILQNLENFDDKIDELEALEVAKEQLAVFRKNYEQLNANLNTAALEKLKVAVEKVKQNTVNMVADINAFIEQIGFDKQYLIEI